MWYSMIGCLLTLFLGLIISAIINSVQKRRVFKINSAKTANSININVMIETNNSNNRKISSTSTATPAVDLNTPEENGHVNHAIRLDDE